MTEEEIKKEIELFIKNNENSNIGMAMKYLANNFTGRYNGQLASKIIKELLR
jgi:uncharacterized protein YqeY